jgi:NTE family protein
VDPIRTLILSGGGGRGAFHAGVYKYLMRDSKVGVNSSHAGVWSPDIVVGTSIGAVNGAAIVQGISASELERIWLSLRENDIEGLPPGMKPITQRIVNRLLMGMIGIPLKPAAEDIATSHTPDNFWPPLPMVPGWLADWSIGRWINILDTGPLKQTLINTIKVDEESISESDKTLLITATNVQTGERTVFTNRTIINRSTGEPRTDVVTGITIDRIMASCSIPLIYPWTYDKDTNAYYWDGALVANTPIGVALDVFQEIPVEVPMELVVVLMTPWIESNENSSFSKRSMPESFDEAITWTFDWVLLASFRERLRLINAYNVIAEKERNEGLAPPQFRKVNVVIVAPDDFFPVSRIIDYDEASAHLIQLGYNAAQNAFESNFSEDSNT